MLLTAGHSFCSHIPTNISKYKGKALQIEGLIWYKLHFPSVRPWQVPSGSVRIGKPAFSTTVNPFTDVKKTDSYYKAVLWAVEKEITKGTSATAFSPNATCKRYQMVVFLKKLHCYMSIDNHLQLVYYGVKLNGLLFRNHTYRDRKCVTDMSVGIGIAPVIISTLCSRDSGNIGGITYGFLF